MSNYHKKAGSILVSFTIVIFFAACTGSVANIQQDDSIPKIDSNGTAQTTIPSQLESNTKDDSSKPQYFFVNGSLLGSYESDGWHSLCHTNNYKTDNVNFKSFYAKDLLNQDCYYVTDGKKQIGVSKRIAWQTEQIPGVPDSFEDKDAQEKLTRYGELYDTSTRVFELPIKLGNELSKLQIPNYSFFTEFDFGEGFERNEYANRLVTNSTVNLFPRILTYHVEPTDQGKQAINDLFKKNDMENTIPNFTECVRGDFDGDYKDEYLMVANSPRGEIGLTFTIRGGWPCIAGDGEKDKVGIFSAILYQDDKGSVQILHSDMRSIHEAVEFNNGYKEITNPVYSCCIDFPSAADLNGDGVYEIIFMKYEWDNGYKAAFSQNEQGIYSEVMRSNWGK